MKKNKSAIVITIIIVVVLIGLFAIPKLTDPNRDLVKRWRVAGVDCLPSHTNATQHIHPRLKIFVDEEPEVIPANIGIVRSCMAEVHTHDASGTIHLESVLAGKTFKLNDFFTVWNKELSRPGFDLEMEVDGLPSEELGNLILKDGQEIILRYTEVNG